MARGKECSDASQKKIIMSRYSDTSVNTHSHWVVVNTQKLLIRREGCVSAVFSYEVIKFG